MANAAEAELYIWMLNFIFYLGVLLVPLGLCLITAPGMVMRFANRVNRWISTKDFFDSMNRPYYQEKFFYRHHRVFGTLIIILSAVCLYLLGVYLGSDLLMDGVRRMTDSEFMHWLILDLYYILLAGLAISLILGIVITVRPSILKNLEARANRWLDTESHLQAFDSTYEIPLRMLPGRLRLFGLFVLAGAAYMIYATGTVLF